MSLQIEQWGLVPYHLIHARQLQLVEKLHNGAEDDVCLIVQHPAVFTLGRNATPEHVTVSQAFLEKKEMGLIRVERGGEVTYHGPGQIVCYPIVRLRRHRLSVVEYVALLEEIMLKVVERFGIEAHRDPRNHGIWCADRKLGSVGIAVRHGISYHGLALNVNLDLEPFTWMKPCGMSGVSMGSMETELQRTVNVEDVERAMKEEIGKAFAAKGVEDSPSRIAKPKWLKQRLPKGAGYEKMRQLVRERELHTVCQEARCPNQFECFGKGTATFMLMGESCTRNCRFCVVNHGEPTPLDEGEPARIAAAVSDMGLSYAVLTSVTRDDLADGGAAHFARTIEASRSLCPETRMEVLIPDLQGNWVALAQLCGHRPSVLNHNMETVASLYPLVRPQAVYERSLALLRRVKEIDSAIVTKSGLMLGLGETEEELIKTMTDISNTGCDLLTLGQYLQPTSGHLAVQRYVVPEEFDRFGEIALQLGFAGVATGPHIRSSYRAGELYGAAILAKSVSLR